LSEIAILLILASAFIHAGWNLIAKRISPTAAFFLAANLFGTWVFFPWVIIYPGIIHDIPAHIWAFLILTGFFQALYCIALAASYRHGDLSVSYPITRSLPVIMVPMVTVLLGRGELLGMWFFVGAVLVLAGGMLVSVKEIHSLRQNFILASVLPMALFAAIGTAGYSLVDDHALRILRGNLADLYGTVPITLVYSFFQAFVCSAWIGIFLVFTRKGSRGTRPPLYWAAAAGMLSYLSYGLVLVSLAFARDVSLIVAFRQVSILAGAFLGFVFLKEPAHRLKIMGLIILVAGLIIVAVT
jgi:drug/metabolite transporter (DMT)-like permease